MLVQQSGDASSGYEHACLHVLLHGIAGEIGAGDEAGGLVGDSDCQSARNFDHVSALNFDQATETISGA